MHMWNTFQALIMYCCLCIIIVQIYDTKFNKTCVLFSLIYIPIFIIAIKTDYHTFMYTTPVLMVINIILLKLCYRHFKIKTIIYWYLFLFMSAAIFTATIVAIVSSNKYLIEVIVYLIIWIVCCVIAFTKTKHKLIQIMEWTPRLIKIIILALLIVMALISTLIYGIHDASTHENWILMIQLFGLLMIVFVCILLPIVVNHSVKNKYLKQLTDDYQKQIQIQANHYEALAKSNWELRRFRHDFKNLWIGLNELIQTEQSEDALDMLNHYHTSFVNDAESILQFDTGNGIVDALLTDKQVSAQSINTTVNFSGAVPSNGISPTDLCVLFGNTLDNAIEACERLPLESKKSININCKPMAGYLFIYIDNPVIEDIQISNNCIPTTKADKNLHGFGLYSLEQIVKNHNGELKLSCSNKVFEVSIDLCIDVK